MYGKDDTKIMVYNMRKWPKRGDRKKPRAKKKKKRLRNKSLKEELWTLD